MVHMNNNYGEASKAELAAMDERAAPYIAWLADNSGMNVGGISCCVGEEGG